MDFIWMLYKHRFPGRSSLVFCNPLGMINVESYRAVLVSLLW